MKQGAMDRCFLLDTVRHISRHLDFALYFLSNRLVVTHSGINGLPALNFSKYSLFFRDRSVALAHIASHLKIQVHFLLWLYRPRLILGRIDWSWGVHFNPVSL